MKKRIKTILTMLLIVLLGMQSFRIDKTNPPHDPANDFLVMENPPAEVAEMMKNACYDCHSNLTKYPWYTNVAPMSWWIAGHIRHAREELNFSEWRSYNEEDKPKGLEEMAEEVLEKKMPLFSYIVAHPEARLSEEQRKVLADWFLSKKNRAGEPEETED
jgi:hypothetical protein